MLSDILGIIGVAIGAIGLGYAWFANRERIKVERFIRSAGWDLYNKASNQNAHVQLVSKQLMTTQNPNLEIIKNISQADAFGQYLLRDAVKIIHYVEPKFDEELISKWVETERIFRGHKEMFMVLTPSINTKEKHRTENVGNEASEQ